MIPNKIENQRYPMGRASSPEPGLFIIWEKGRQAQERILEHIAGHFHICGVTEFRWSPSMVWANYRRFYSDIRLRGSAHARNKGVGPFLAINVIVESPIYEERELNRDRGVRKVNTAMFDAKTRYREWTSEYSIHCGETLSENLRDIYMLFGLEFAVSTDREWPRWNGVIDTVDRDLIGARGWRSFGELFGALNRSIDYTLIYYGRIEETMDGVTRGHSFDILTADYLAAHAILHSGPRVPEPPKYGGEIEISVNEMPLKLNLQYPGDALFDESWGNEILDGKVIDTRGFYRPREDQQYWLMAHRAVVQREPIDHAYMRQLMTTFENENGLIPSRSVSDNNVIESFLTDQLVERGLWQSNKNSRTRRLLGIVISEFRQTYERLAARIRTSYFIVRDTILVYLPFLGSLKKSIAGDTGDRRP